MHEIQQRSGSVGNAYFKFTDQNSYLIETFWPLRNANRRSKLPKEMVYTDTVTLFSIYELSLTLRNFIAFKILDLSNLWKLNIIL